MLARILIIDDENLFRENLADLLREEGHDCQTASSGSEGLACFGAFSPDVVLCDISMPDMDGIDVLEKIMQGSPESFVIMITAYGALDTAVEAFRKGASDYISKPLLLEDVLHKIAQLMKYKELAREVRFLRRQVSQDLEDFPLVGQSEAMHRLFLLIRSVGPTRSTVLITGESGTGKELVAKAIHGMNGEEGAPNLPFVAINCAGIPEELLESELFGHIRGAFTGAINDRVGHFELAGEGTIFLDEIGDMPLALQSKLLRVLEEKEFVPIGGAQTVPLKARIIAATNQDLRKLVKEKEFREDLFFRIAVFEVPLPPLRERWHDIPLLVEHFVKRLNTELKRKCLGVDHE
ncbi:MAG: sigma-54 dependent transcriptional regulator, partial [Candidatus Hydrogenedentes bacterium]|nr:sigma-54 dependent transcriptional regulator [Candidatus Hydrogenedentota bacterium]